MTFVAQPYERFVDDLLIALTGGTIREEHEFAGIDRAYALGSPDAIVDSLRVFGQRDGAFTVFERGVDYRYDATEQALAWELEGLPPDDRTPFYVSYFTGDGTGRLTDRNPGSVTTTLAGAFARQYGVLHKEMELIYRSAFVDTAQGRSLDYVAALLDVERKDARFAAGEVLFKRTTPAPGDIAVSAGTLVSTPDGQAFETTATRTLRRDQLSVVVPVRAQVEGPAGLAPAGAISVVNRPIFGIESVVNERAMFFAAERESDDELRRRVRGRLHRAGRSTLEAIRTNLIDGVAELDEGNVQVSERPESPGVVDVRVGVAETADETFAARIDAALLQARPAGVRVLHNAAAPAAAAAPPAPSARADVVAGFAAAETAEQPVSFASAPAADALAPVRVQVLLRLAEPKITVSEREAVETSVRDEIVRYVDGLPMGAPLVYAKLLGRVVAAAEIADARLMVGPASGDAPPQHRANVDAAGRKFTVDPRDVAIYLMDQRVRLDVRVRVEESAAGGVPEVSAALEAAVDAAARRALEQAAGSVDAEALRAAVAPVVAGAPALIVAERDPIVLTATYEESGRIVVGAPRISLAEHEVVVPGSVRVELLGVLGG